jgi:hypothetical protein
MNSPTLTPAPLSAQTSIKPGQVYIVGRMFSVRKAGQSFLHLVTMPAEDAYSNPQTVEIVAKNRLGAKDDDVKVLCRIGGFRRSYKQTDQETGEVRQVATANNKFFAVE